eukprot:357563_1
MANYLVSILGDSLTIPSLEDANIVPSPESLMRKIIVKGKTHVKHTKVFEKMEKENTANDVEGECEDNDNEGDSPLESGYYFDDDDTTTTQGNNDNNGMRRPDCDKIPPQKNI